MPERFICEQVPPPSQKMAFFSGSVYGERSKWLEEPRLKGLLARAQSANADRLYSLFFDTLPAHRFGFPYLVKQPRFPASLTYPIYLNLLRRIRQSAFIMWQQSVLQRGAAVVNLPHLVKGYSGRVIEGMAAGRPVISWQIPERPRNTAMFEDGKEILLYSTPEELATQIERVLSDPEPSSLGTSLGQIMPGNGAIGDMDGGFCDAIHVDQLRELVAMPLKPRAQAL